MITSSTNASQVLRSNDTHSDPRLIGFLGPVYTFSGIFIAVLSTAATFGNGFLLLAIWKDPFRAFRVPSTVFVIGLAVADLLTGLLVGPVISYIRIAPQSERNTDRFSGVFQFGTTMSYLTMNASYLVLLFLTWNQFAAIRFPHQHRNFITTQKVAICVVGVWVYSILFSLLHFCGINAVIVRKLDFYVHTTACVILLVVAYVCLFIAFQNQVQRITLATTHHSVQGASNGTRRQRHGLTRTRKRRSEKQFTALTLVLVLFIIICTLPSLILQFLHIYWKPTSFKETLSIRIALEICSDVLFLKFALDPFIYCWRLTSYRRALKSVLMIGRIGALGIDQGNPCSFTRSVQPREGAIGVSLVSGRRESYILNIQVERTLNGLCPQRQDERKLKAQNDWRIQQSHKAMVHKTSAASKETAELKE